MRKVHFVVLFALLAGLALSLPSASSAQVMVGVSVRIGPPPLRVYAQPMCPGPGYLWAPGYWAYGPDGYYWVPGSWVMPPQPGLLWTPGWWGWEGGGYRWHAGYWGPHVGFYGGINYGFGYFGTGFVGGHWDHDRFYYNTAVWRVNTRVVRNVYVDHDVVRNVRVNRVSYNGGHGGIEARPSRDDERWSHERRWNATPMQTRHEEGFRGNRGRNFHPPDRGNRDEGRANDRGFRGNDRGNRGMAGGNDRGYRGNDRGNRGRENVRGNDRGRGNQDRPNQSYRQNDRGNGGGRNKQDRGREDKGKQNNGRGQEKQHDHGRR